MSRIVLLGVVGSLAVVPALLVLPFVAVGCALNLLCLGVYHGVRAIICLTALAVVVGGMGAVGLLALQALMLAALPCLLLAGLVLGALVVRASFRAPVLA